MTAAMTLPESGMPVLASLIAWAFEAEAPVRAGEDQVSAPRSGSRVLIAGDAFDRAAVVNIVNRLGPCSTAWLRTAYGDKCSWDADQSLTVYCWGLWYPEQPPMRSDTLSKAKSLMYLALQEQRRICRGHGAQYKPAEICELLGVEAANYRQHWKCRWHQMLVAYQMVDDMALADFKDRLSADPDLMRRLGVYLW
ncbi:bacteriophage antitermination protein Q [Oceanospirillum sp. HFRX-1_2]